jgi:predicted aldo/keto reductase-like oxidoreductase
MRLPLIGDKAHLIDETKAQEMVDYAVEHGINYFDTAFIYHSEVPFQPGQSEIFLGRALKRQRRNIHLATKLPSWFVQTRADMDRFLDQQLQRLQTDHIDFYLVHGLTGEAWDKLNGLGIRSFLDTALADGRIKHAGFSFHDEAPLFRPIVDGYDWSFCQIQYNFMDESFQAGRAGLEYASGKGLGVIIMEPLRGGGLTNRIPTEVQAMWDKAVVKRTPAEWALRFVWNRPEASVVLSGMSTLGQIEENVRIANQGLSDSLTVGELGLIEEVRAIYQARTRVNCTSCGYCLPCPQGVNIPANFLQLNTLSIYRDRPTAEFFYFHLLNAQQRASNCAECGQCEERCPQHISIQDMLKEAVGEFESHGG